METFSLIPSTLESLVDPSEFLQYEEPSIIGHGQFEGRDVVKVRVVPRGPPDPDSAADGSRCGSR